MEAQPGFPSWALLFPETKNDRSFKKRERKTRWKVTPKKQKEEGRKVGPPPGRPPRYALPKGKFRGGKFTEGNEGAHSEGPGDVLGT